MGLQLRKNLEFCISGGRVVFLDLDSDRYFALADHNFDAFQRWSNGEAMLEHDSQALHRLANQRILIQTDHADVKFAGSAFGLVSPTTRLNAKRPRVSPISLGRAIWARILWNQRVKSWSLERLIAKVQGTDRRSTCHEPSDALPMIVRSFEIADLILGNHDRCLERSLALAAVCRSQGLANTLVIGVQADPFAAHCWVQDQANVLNEHPDRVAMFTPILAL